MRWVLWTALVAVAAAVICEDCVGRNCLGSSCEGDYCILSRFAPRWGLSFFGTSEYVRGCMSGSMLRKDIRDHCEVPDDDSDEVFTCFCKGKYCNRRPKNKVEKEVVELITCRCEGDHCRRNTCQGELCIWVKNHESGAIEKGCVNATVPLVERRSIGSCMTPPITGAMYHSVAATAEELLKTESCVCGQDYCNDEQPKLDPKRDTQRCQMFVKGKTMTKMESRTLSCRGEFCFKTEIKSSVGPMKEYSAIGCATFSDEDELPEELNPIGCAEFTSEKLNVSACYTTKDKNALGRARARQQVPEPPTRKAKGKNRQRGSFEVDEYDEPEKPPKKQPPRQKPVPEEVEQEEEEREEEKEERPETTREQEKTTTKESFIWVEPTQPPIPDDSNTTMIAIFVLIMLCIVVSGAVWKLQLHKKLLRSSYDTVAGG